MDGKKLLAYITGSVDQELTFCGNLNGLFLIFFIKPYLWVNRTLGIEWDLSMIRTLSATPANYVSSSSRLYGDLIGFPQAGQQTDFLFPGLTLILLGAIGTWLLITDRGGTLSRDCHLLPLTLHNF